MNFQIITARLTTSKIQEQLKTHHTSILQSIYYTSIFIMQKNFHIKKNSTLSHKKKSYQLSSNLILLSKSSKQSTSEALPTIKEIQKRVKNIWESINSMNVQISEQAINKYIKKTMQRKCYRYVDYILECFRCRRAIKTLPKIEQLNVQQLIYQLQDLKTEVQDFLWRKFCKDIDILEAKIRFEDESIRNNVEISQYRLITGAFNPRLVSNPSDLIEEFNNIGGHPTKRNCSRLQQMRYVKLAKSEQNVSKMHSSVCQSKEDFKIFD